MASTRAQGWGEGDEAVGDGAPKRMGCGEGTSLPTGEILFFDVEMAYFGEF